MHLIEVTLAFALLMVLFSSVASGFTELALRILPARILNLRRSVRRFSEDILWPNVQQALPEGHRLTEEDREKALADITDALTRNLAQPDSTGTLADKALNWSSRHWIDALSTQGFIERLAKSDMGRVFASEDADTRASRLKEISLSFERYMAMSSEVFRKQANLMAFLVSVALAGIGNIHVGRIVDHLRQNPDVVATINAQAEEITQAALQQPAPAPDTETVEEITEALNAYRAELTDIQATYDLPIGFDYYPYGDALAYEHENAVIGFGLWAIHILISGLLIGLGAPFWYRIVKNIGQVKSSAQALAGGSAELVGKATPQSEGQSAIQAAEGHAALFDTVAQLDTLPKVDDDPAPVG